MLTISEALGWLQTLKQRHTELTALRNQNATRNRVRYGNQPDTVEEPVYEVKALDRRVTLLAREIRLLTDAIKRANAKTEIPDYKRDDEVLGELA